MASARAAARRVWGGGLIVVGVLALGGSAVGLVTSDDSATTTTPAWTTTTTMAVDAAEASRFVRELTRAVNASDTTFLLAHLDPLVTGIYGIDACAAHLDAVDKRRATTVIAAEGPAAFVFAADGLSVTVPDVWNVRVNDATTGSAVLDTVHVGTRTGEPTWFVDCGTPLPPDQQQLPQYEVET